MSGKLSHTIRSLALTLPAFLAFFGASPAPAQPVVATVQHELHPAPEVVDLQTSILHPAASPKIGTLQASFSIIGSSLEPTEEASMPDVSAGKYGRSNAAAAGDPPTFLALGLYLEPASDAYRETRSWRDSTQMMIPDPATAAQITQNVTPTVPVDVTAAASGSVAPAQAAEVAAAVTSASSAAPNQLVEAPASAPSDIDSQEAAPPVDASLSPASAHSEAAAGTTLPHSPVQAPLTTSAPKTASSNQWTAGEDLYYHTHDLSGVSPTSWAIEINKSHHEMLVFFKGRLFGKYSAVFGRRLDGFRKLIANDRRTPEGVYSVIDKYPSHRFHWFLKLNYPNDQDIQRYSDRFADGIIPVDGEAPKALGGMIGIHGTDVPVLNEGLINWTMGCISVDNRTIELIAAVVPVGTVVIIRP